MQKKAKMHSYKKKTKMEKEKANLFGFLHFKPKNSCRKSQKCKKNYFFQIRKIHMQKKVENNISKKHVKKMQKCKKKCQKRQEVHFN